MIQPIMSPHKTLKRWIEREKIAPAEFARRIDYDRSNLHNMLKGRVWPSMATALRIERETGGAVPLSAWAEAKAALQDRAA